jgi:predicted dehydrogenase
LSYADAVKMVEASRKHNKFFMEAFWTRFIPSVLEALYKINNDEIGDIKYINADFAFFVNELEGNRMTDVKLGGGALFDIGVYPLFLSYIILGKPKDIIAKSTYHKTGVDLQTTMILQYEEAQAVLHAGFISESDMKASISGTQGRIELNSPWFMADGYTIFKDNHEAVFNLPNFGKGYAHEALECHYCIKNNLIESHHWSHQNSLDLSEIVEEVKNQIGLEFI